MSNFVSEERCREIAQEMIPQFVRQARSEAIKEFAKKVKKITFHYYDSDIDDALKEAIGGM